MNDDALKRIQAVQGTYSKGTSSDTLILAKECGKPDVMTSGFPELDTKVLEIGGIPIGGVSELSGESNAGKSTLAMNFLKHAVEQDLICCYADMENTMDYEYGEIIGVHRDHYMMLKKTWVEEKKAKKKGDPPIKIVHSLTGVEFLESVLRALESGVQFLIIDSMSFVQADEATETKLSDQKMNTDLAQGKMTKRFISQLIGGWKSYLYEGKDRSKAPTISIEALKCTVIIISHLKNMGIGGSTFGKPEKDSGGGEKMKFGYSMRIFLERFGRDYSEGMLDEFGRPIFSKVKITCHKSKLASGGAYTTMWLNNKEGKFISDKGAVLDLAEAKKIVGRPNNKGAWYYWTDSFKENTALHDELGLEIDPKAKWQGKENFTNYVNENDTLLKYILGIKADSEGVNE